MPFRSVQITGTATATLDDVTLTATGALAITGTESVTLNDITLSATGALEIQASLNVTLDDITLEAYSVSEALARSDIVLDDVTFYSVGIFRRINITKASTIGQVTTAPTISVDTPIKSRAKLDQITKAQQSLPAHITKPVAQVSHITA